MAAAETWVTAARLAELAGVSRPTVSNWRRRHADFPLPQSRDGQEVYRAEEVAGWLGRRPVARTDLKTGEHDGATYGDRFRVSWLGPAARSSARTARTAPPAPERLESLRRELDRLRGGADAAAYAEAVLGLLHLSVRSPKRWAEIVGAEDADRLPLVEQAFADQGSALAGVQRSWRSVAADGQGAARLGQVVRLVDRAVPAMGDHRGRDRGQVAETFRFLLSRFTALAAHVGGVVTPASVARVAVELAAPAPAGRLLDLGSDSGGFALEASRYLAAHGHDPAAAAFTVRPLDERWWEIAAMNLELHGIAARFAGRPAGSLTETPAEHFDVVLANPPFNMRADQVASSRRYWPFGEPPPSNANFAWLQHIWCMLDEGGRAAVVMPNSAASSQQPVEAGIRREMVERGVVEAVVALPAQLFSTTGIPVTIWVLRRSSGIRSEEILFLDARDLGRMVGRAQRALAPEEIQRIADALGTWRAGQGRHVDVPGFSAAVRVADVRENSYRLMPGRYVGRGAEPAASAPSLSDLLPELDRLHRRAAEADAAAERQLRRIATWTR